MSTSGPRGALSVELQLSVASTAASLAAGTWAAHWTVLSGAHWVITGGVASLTVIVWVRSEERRVGKECGYRRVTVNLPGQLPGVSTAGPCATVTVPPQLSVASTAASLAASTCAAPWTVLSGAHWVITGEVVSLTVIVWVQVALLPQASAAV